MVRAPCCQKMGLKKGPWTPEEDEILINYIKLYGHSNWRALPKQAGNFSCSKKMHQMFTSLTANFHNLDLFLLVLILCSSLFLVRFPGLLRCGKSCRLRWTNYLSPDIKRGNFTMEEEDTIINLHEMLGNRCVLIEFLCSHKLQNSI